MIKTTYTCDKCSHEQENGKGFWNIGIVLSPGETPPYKKIDHPQKALWCDKCVIEMGVKPLPEEKTPLNPISLEDLVREIVVEEIENNQG